MSLCIAGEACTPNLAVETAPLVVIIAAFVVAWWWLRRLAKLKEWRGR